jgi:hypothetical protein
MLGGLFQAIMRSAIPGSHAPSTKLSDARQCGSLREIAQSRVRYGYRNIRVLLNREGWDVGKYLVYRLYKEEGLELKRRSHRKRKAVRHREKRFIATAPNQHGVSTSARHDGEEDEMS